MRINTSVPFFHWMKSQGIKKKQQNQSARGKAKTASPGSPARPLGAVRHQFSSHGMFAEIKTHGRKEKYSPLRKKKGKKNKKKKEGGEGKEKRKGKKRRKKGREQNKRRKKGKEKFKKNKRKKGKKIKKENKNNNF